MSVSLFRRWRSQKFSDLVGQESVVSTLQNVLGAGDTARAYLFCGPRGTGKTSSARIFAKALNCERGPAAEPCNECTQCRSISDGSNMDVFEIDAASHTQVDKIRDFIVEKVHFSPVSARYKVYIIDEVHKLSTSSFNALLKTLEEPPSHVVFILATTHPHEMPATILSRCQRYDFRPLTASETERHLHMIARQENIRLDEDAARQLARAADGSLRDALVLFEQADVFAQGEVTREKVLDLLGGVGYEVLEEMFTDLHRGEAASALGRLHEWITRGRDLKRLAESFQDHLRMMLLLKVKSEDESIKHLSGDERESLDRLTQALSVGAITQWLRGVGEMLGQIRHGRGARLEWEMFLVSLAHPESEPSMAGVERRLERLESGSSTTTVSSKTPDSGEFDALRSQVAMLSIKLADLEALSSSEPGPPEVLTLAAPHRSEAVESEPAALAPTKSEPVEIEPAVKDSALVTERPTEKIPAEATVGSPSSLATDPVDDWMKMPEVLVRGRVSQSGQISLLDSMAEASPDPTPGVPPKSPVRPAPEPTLEAAESVDFDQAPSPGHEPVAPVRSEPVSEPQVWVTQSEISVGSAPETEKSSKTSDPQGDAAMPEAKEFFRLLMQHVKERDIRLHAVLADAKLISLSSTVFELALPVGYDWHFTKIGEGKELLESVASIITNGLTLQMECGIGGEKAAPPKENEHEELVKRASGVFGGSSIME